MNILYITHLSGFAASGPTYSVPAQISAQAKYDNVFWWNRTDAELDEWKNNKLFHAKKEYNQKRITNLPSPFNNPDLVVFEDFYYIDDVFRARECEKRKIPYIIVPRGALTKQGQSQKKTKKKLANAIFFSHMVKKAAAIQFLTKKEMIDSGKKWNAKYFVEPNGINARNKPEKKSSKDKLTCTLIGRFDVYHKGLDLLLDTVDRLKDKLKDIVEINLYGPERNGEREEYKAIIKEKRLESIMKVNEGVFGNEKEDVLRNTEVFIMCSRYEGMPMALIEAMSFGIPCLVTEGTNMRSVIEENKAGWGCDNSSDGLVSAFEQMIENIPLIGEYGQNAYETSKRYDWDTIAKSSHSKYEKIVGI